MALASSRRRPLFWVAPAGSLALFLAGAAVAVTGYLAGTDAAGTVQGYFAAIARGDAASALGYGELPGGSAALLTRDVLAEQRRIAPISQLSIRGVQRVNHGSASVGVRYRLGFSTGSIEVTDDVAVVQRGRSWRLAHAAVPVSLDLTRARNRASIAGGGVPAGDVALFPGAMPIVFDTPNLVLGDGVRVVRFAASGRLDVSVGVSPAGRSAALAAVGVALAHCLSATGDGDPRCPVPNDRRAVPGSLRGAASPSGLTVSVADGADSADGRLDIAGWVTVTGHYAKLDFENVPVTTPASTPVGVSARCYATAPDRIQWVTS